MHSISFCGASSRVQILCTAVNKGNLKQKNYTVQTLSFYIHSIMVPANFDTK